MTGLLIGLAVIWVLALTIFVGSIVALARKYE
jgi:hypothetical protein